MKKILIVDDIEQNLYMLQVLLSANGFQVEQALNGAEALECARRAPPDMIISDILMPVMDGYALCRIWKEDERLKNIPFVFYSATYTEPKDQEFALKLGADRFILKPVEPDKFLALILETEKDFEAGKPAIACQPIEPVEYYKEYNAALVRKLENKMLQLEKVNHDLELDIAERKRAEEALEFNNTILRTQQESSIDGILIVDENGGIISCNQRFIGMWAILPDVIESKSDGRALQSVMDKLRTPEEFMEKVKYLYGARDETSRDEIALKDGRTFDRYSAPMNGVDGKYYGRVWYFRDITERKQAEEERGRTLARIEGITQLRQSLLAPAPLEEKLKKVTDSIVRIFDADFCRMWLIRPGDRCEQGCVHAQVQEGPHVCRDHGRCLHLLSSSGRYTHIDGRDHSRVPFGCYKIGRVASGEEHKFVSNDVQNDPCVHNHTWARDLGLVSFSVYQIRVPGGQAMGVMALFSKHPITPAEDGMLDGLSSTVAFVVKQDDAEKSLRESEERYRTLIETLGDGITQTDEEGRITVWNPAAEKIFGIPKSDALGRNLWDLQYQVLPLERKKPEILPYMEAALRKMLKSGKGDTPEEMPEMEILQPDGKKALVQTTFSAIPTEKGFLLSSLSHDVTERDEMEKEKELLQSQLLQAQKMEAVGTLAGGVAHDFNNLLTAISGYTTLAMMKIDESNPMHRDLKQVSIAAAKAADVISQLLLFSRKQHMEPVPMDLNTSISHLLKMLDRLIGEDIEIETNLEKGLFRILGDEGNIEQVLMNLSVNARDAMPKGGKLFIKTENITIDEEYCRCCKGGRPGHFVCLSVSDTGTGMDKQTLDHIFEPFFTTKPAGKGTGLGLSVVFGIVQEHKGWINVYSEPGHGTTFKAYFPSSSAIPEQKNKNDVSIASLKGKGERVLIVEDQPEVRELAVEMLATNGYSVFPVSTAKEARELFKKENGRFDLVFSDVVLTDTTGILLVEELRKRGKFKVIFASGYTDEKAHWDMIKENNYPFLQKPYSMRSLLQTVKEELSGKSVDG